MCVTTSARSRGHSLRPDSRRDRVRPRTSPSIENGFPGSTGLTYRVLRQLLRIGVGTSELQHECIDFFRVDMPSRSTHNRVKRHESLIMYYEVVV
jgi:hypothetical protein